MMKKIRNIIIAMLLFTTVANAQDPNWIVDENNFEYTMSFVAFVNIEGTTLSSENDKVGAFVDDELRGTSNLIFASSNGRYYAYLTVFSNINDEVVNFKVYDSNADQVIDISETINFEINAHQGDLFQAYSIASPALNNEADVLDFGLEATDVNSVVIDGQQIALYVNTGVDLSALNATFQLSDGAQLFVNSTLEASGSNSLNFTNPVICKVRSENESQVKEWVVSVQYSSVTGGGDLVYYKKDAVCYNGGEVKVEYNTSGVEVQLLSNLIVIATQTIVNGQTIFSNLDVGTYVVRAEGVDREIIINLKE
ncbi:MAG: hypothetical protein ACJARX_002322 [Psychroserpens sp.]|jgi:hypothetical protein